MAVRAAWRGEPVYVTGERLLATVFHPELGGDDRMHQLFLRQIAQAPAAKVLAVSRERHRGHLL